MKKTIYAADDEKEIRNVLSDFLKSAGYKIITFSNGESLLTTFKNAPCDLVILDIMMPGTDGLTICRSIRKISDVPIIILTAKESERDYIRGFELGGDDYIIKPFSPSLLVVRINAMLRRVELSSVPKRITEFGDLIFSEHEHTITCNGSVLPFTMTEFSLFKCLIENPGMAVSRDTLLSEVWNINSRDIETRVTDETIRRIRYKLKNAGSRVKITAVWGYGYKLEEQVETNKI